MTESGLCRAVLCDGTVVVIAAASLLGCRCNSRPVDMAPSVAGAIKATVSPSLAMAKKAAPDEVEFVFARTANQSLRIARMSATVSHVYVVRPSAMVASAQRTGFNNTAQVAGAGTPR